MKKTIFQMTSKALLTIFLISLASHNVQAAIDCNSNNPQYKAARDYLIRVIDTKNEAFTTLPLNLLGEAPSINKIKNAPNLKSSFTTMTSRALSAAKKRLELIKV